LKRQTTAVVSLVLIGSMLGGCSSPPKVPLQAQAKKTIRTVAVVQIAEPEKYHLYVGQLPGGAAFYMLGALGGLMLGGIEAMRAQSATSDFMQSISTEPPAVGALWNYELPRAVESRGYTVKVLKWEKNLDDLADFDCKSVQGKYDALLLSNIRAGYSVETMVEPNIVVNAKLLGSDCKSTLYSESFVYAAKAAGNVTHIVRNAEYAFDSKKDLLANPKKSSRGLRSGTRDIVQRLASEL
jgi:hypothetical protein